MTDIRQIIASGVRLNQQQDDEAYMILSPEEYYAIPETQKPLKDEVSALFSFTVQSATTLQTDWCIYSVNNWFLGMCKLEQMLMLPDMIRSKTFRHGTGNQPIVISLLASLPNQAAAQLHYDTLLSTGSYVKALNKTENSAAKLRCTTDGNEFKSVTQAADFYAISRTSIYDSINGKKNPRNLSFERIRK